MLLVNLNIRDAQPVIAAGYTPTRVSVQEDEEKDAEAIAGNYSDPPEVEVRQIAKRLFCFATSC